MPNRKKFLPAGPSESESSASKFRSLCRALGLTLLYVIISRIRGNKSVAERKKTAIRRDRKVAGLAGAIHFLPVGTAISMCALNLKGYYIGGELAGPLDQDTEKFAGLQFAAKLHELTINASLATMILTYIRHELAIGRGVPFGAIFAGMHFQHISVLWSLEFWGAVFAKETKRRRKCILLTMIVTGALLGVSVGPASASILRPRLDDWPAGGTEFWINGSAQDIWPTELTKALVQETCATDTGDLSCPYGSWQTFADGYLSHWPELVSEGYMPNAIQIPGPKSIRQVVLDSSNTKGQFNNGDATSSAFMPYAAIAGALTETGRYWAWAARNLGGKWRFQYRRNAVYDVSTIQPLVHTKCFAFDNASDTFPFYDLYDDHNGVTSFNYTLPKIEPLLPSSIKGANSSGNPILSWYTIPQASNKTNLAAIAFVPALELPVFTCTVDARQMPILQRSQRNEIQLVDSKEPGYVNPSGNGLVPISVDPQWASFLNPTILQSNLTAFGSMVRSAGLWNTTQKTDKALHPAAVESIIALMVVNGIARSDWKYSIVGNLKGLPPEFNNDISKGCAEWCQQIMPRHGLLGYGGSAFDFNASLYPNATMLTMHAHSSGYAYSSKGKTTKVSIIILLFYSTLAVLHWLYLFCVGETSSSWDSSGEIAALALNSPRTDMLRNTGAGIESTETFAAQVRVVAVGDRLELSFDRASDQEEMKLNGLYG